jgi:hypothetical protein
MSLTQTKKNRRIHAVTLIKNLKTKELQTIKKDKNENSAFNYILRPFTVDGIGP